MGLISELLFYDMAARLGHLGGTGFRIPFSKHITGGKGWVLGRFGGAKSLTELAQIPAIQKELGVGFEKKFGTALGEITEKQISSQQRSWISKEVDALVRKDFGNVARTMGKGKAFETALGESVFKGSKSAFAKAGVGVAARIGMTAVNVLMGAELVGMIGGGLLEAGRETRKRRTQYSYGNRLNTNAAFTQRQASLALMQDSVYATRNMIGNEASMMHG